MNRFLLVLMMGLGWVSTDAEASLKASDLSSAQLKAVSQFLSTEVKADLQATWQDQMLEVSQASGGGDPTWGGLLVGDPMTPQTQDLLAKGVYLLVSNNLSRYGVSISESLFKEKVKYILALSARMGIFPSAITAGYMGRVQAGVGGSFGSQFNLYFDKGALTASEYSIYGVHAGFAEMTKMQFYVSFCFGTCFGGDAAGWYIGMDGTGAAIGGMDLFVEGGVDVTDLMKYTWAGEAYSTRDLYKSKAIYLGFGFDVGQGVGISGDVFYYTHDFDLTLLKAKEKFNPNVVKQLKLH